MVYLRINVKRNLLPFIIGAIIVVFILCVSNKAHSETQQKYDYYQVIEKRDIFKPLWNVITDDGIERKRREEEIKKEEEKRKKEEEQRIAELKRREEQNLLNIKKAEIENTLVLSGIVFDGQRYLALIEDKRGRGGSSMYAVGDVIRDTTIESIDELKKEVILNYQGKLKIILRLSK